MIIGLIAAVISGASAPTIAIIFGEIIAIFDPNNTKEEVQDGITLLFQLIGVLCGVMWIFGYMQFAFLQASAERLSFDLRTLYLRALLRQETEYFEKQQDRLNALRNVNQNLNKKLHQRYTTARKEPAFHEME